MTSNKRKSRKSAVDEDAAVVKPEPSSVFMSRLQQSPIQHFCRPDASPLPKKKRVQSPIPAPRTTEDEDEAGEEDNIRPRRLYVVSFMHFYRS